MQKTKRLMDNNIASFQTFSTLLSCIAAGSYIQISEVHVTLYSSNVKEILKYLGEHAQKPKLRDYVKKVLTAFRVGTIFAWFNFSRLSLAFTLRYYPSCMC